MQTPDGIDEIIATFGDIHPYILTDGTLSPEWEKDEMARCVLPFAIPLDWNRATTVSMITCHKNLVDVFEKTFQEIVDQGLQDAIKTYGGCFAYRPQRGSTKLSTHAWGISIDLNPFENQQGTAGNMDDGVINVFRANGFDWGGNFLGSRKDPMHFQFATGY